MLTILKPNHKSGRISEPLLFVHVIALLIVSKHRGYVFFERIHNLILLFLMKQMARIPYHRKVGIFKRRMIKLDVFTRMPFILASPKYERGNEYFSELRKKRLLRLESSGP